MNRPRAVWVAALIAVVVLVGLLMLKSLLAPAFESGPNEHREIQTTLVAAAKKAGDCGTVRMSEAFSGTWDTVWVCDGYTADRDHKVFPEVDFGTGGYGVDYVIAFANAGGLAAWVRFNVNEPLVYFDLPNGVISVARDQAIFKVIEDDSSASDTLLRLVGPGGSLTPGSDCS